MKEEIGSERKGKGELKGRVMEVQIKQGKENIRRRTQLHETNKGGGKETHIGGLKNNLLT
jgi:hypothetical protein